MSEKTLKISWQDKIPFTKALKKAGMQRVHALLKLLQLGCTGDVTIMSNERLPKEVFYE